MTPKVSYALKLTPDEPLDRTLDRQARVSLAQPLSGLSPISLALAYTDWVLHLFTSPGSQSRLARQAMRQGVEWLADSTATLAQWAPAWLSLGEKGACWPFPATAQSQTQSQLPLSRALDDDPRFADDAWHQWPWRGLATASKGWESWWQEASSIRGMEDHSRQQMRFYGGKVLDLYSPSNWLLTNPQALKTAWDTHGQSLLKGLGQVVDEMRLRKGSEALLSREQDPSPGKGMAMTPGRVVMRNGLVELIQYSPTTTEVHETPVLIIPSCVMKYYILDLSPENSMVRWLVAQGHTVYIVSWRNPDESDALLSMDDYVETGILASLHHVHQATGQAVHLVGYCLGGTFAAIAAAALAEHKPHPLRSLTLLAAMTDFKDPGEMQVLIDEAQVTLLEDLMASQGFLTGQQMAGSFRFLHSRELVWSDHTKRWLLGEDEIGNDLMVWNADVTRLPAVMHSQYLRSCCLDNDLAEGRFAFQGEPVSLRDIRLPVFGVGTVKDHVSPWRSTYEMHRLVSGPVTFALTNGGHNAGIVSEPGHPRRYFHLLDTGPRHPWRTPDEWLAEAERREGSWWTAWDAWLEAHGSGRQVPARLPPSDDDLGDAPGRYVLVRYGD